MNLANIHPKYYNLLPLFALEKIEWSIICNRKLEENFYLKYKNKIDKASTIKYKNILFNADIISVKEYNKIKLISYYFAQEKYKEYETRLNQILPKNPIKPTYSILKTETISDLLFFSRVSHDFTTNYNEMYGRFSHSVWLRRELENEICEILKEFKKEIRQELENLKIV